MYDAPLRTTTRTLIIVPAFNEAGAISKLVTRLHRSLPEMDILVIDDGSTDATAREAQQHCKTICLPFNTGIGGAMQTGYRYADLNGYDIAVQVDGDGQHRPREVRKLVEYIASGNADLVVGSRFLERGEYRQQMGRRVGATVLRLLLKAFTNQDITDCTSGFRAVNRRVIRAFAHYYPDDYPEPEVILLLHRAGYGVRELPVSMRQRRNGRSSITGLCGIFYVLKVSMCLGLDLVRHPWNNGKVNAG